MFFSFPFLLLLSFPDAFHPPSSSFFPSLEFGFLLVFQPVYFGNPSPTTSDLAFLGSRSDNPTSNLPFSSSSSSFSISKTLIQPFSTFSICFCPTSFSYMSNSATISSTRVLQFSRKLCRASAHMVYPPPPSNCMSFLALLLGESSFPLASFFDGCSFDLCGVWWRKMAPSSLGLCLVRSLAWDSGLWSVADSLTAMEGASLVGFSVLGLSSG